MNLFLFMLMLVACVQTKCEDSDTMPADDSKTSEIDDVTAAESVTQQPQAQFVYNPYGVNDYTLGQLFGQPEPGLGGGVGRRQRVEPFYFYTREEDEEIDPYNGGPIEPFSFNEERINLEHFERKKKLGDAEFANLERGDYLDPSNVDRRSFLVVTGGLFPNNEVFTDVPQLKYGKKAEREFNRLRQRFRTTLQRYPPYYLDDPYQDYVENYPPAPPETDNEILEHPPVQVRPTLPPYSQPPPRTRRPVVAEKKTRKPTNAPKKAPKPRKKVRRRKPKPKTKAPTTAPPRARNYPVDILDDFDVFGRRIEFSPPKITPGDRIDQQYYGKAEPRPRTRSRPTVAPRSYAPTPSPRSYAPTPAPRSYAPTPAPRSYAPTPAPRSYAPTPAPRSYAPTPAPRSYAPTPAPRSHAPTPVPRSYVPTTSKPPRTKAPPPSTRRPQHRRRRPTNAPRAPKKDSNKGVARVYHYSTFGNSGNMRGFAYTIVV